MARPSNAAKEMFERYEALKSDKQTWMEHYQRLAEMFLTRKSDFTEEFTPGEFLNDELFDGSPSKLAKTAASTLFGMLWGDAPLQLEPGDEIDDPNSEEREFFDTITQTMHRLMNHPKSGLEATLSEYQLDNFIFGTASIYPKAGKDHPVVYSPWNVKSTCIEQGEDGRVNAIFHEEKLTLRQIAERYGEENLSARMREKITKGLANEKEKVLFCIVPREKPEAEEGVLAMPFRSYHFEVEGKYTIKEGGFDRFPVPTNRFEKALNESMGRSWAMDALPDAQELQIVREHGIVAKEMQLFPPMAVHDDGSLGLGKLDTSPRAVNVFHVTGKLNGLRPVEPLFAVGNVAFQKDELETLINRISSLLGLDRLLDLNNDTQMTLGEAQMRDRIRSLSLRSVFARQILEVYEPLVRLTFDILFEQGLLGVEEGSIAHEDAIARGQEPLLIPKRVAEVMAEKGVDAAYKVRYITPASRILRSERFEGIMQLWQAGGVIAQMSPEVLDKLNADKSIEQIADLLGVSEELLNDDDNVTSIRETRAKQQQEMAEAQKQQMQADTLQKVANV